MNLDFSQILIQIVAFLLMLWVLKRYGWKPLLDMLDERKHKIQSEFDSIASKNNEAKKLIEEYREKLKDIDKEARNAIQDAVAQGRKIAAEMEADAQSSAKEILAKAKIDVDREIEKAGNQLKNDLVNMVVATTEKILHQNLDRQEQQRLIADLLKEADIK